MNLELTEQIVALMGKHPVSEITVEQEGFRVHVCRPLSASAFASPFPPAASVDSEGVALEVPEETAAEAEAAPPETRTLTATMVGIFHHTKPPLPYGAMVTPGDIVGCIESMKLMNDVAAEWGGRIIEALTEDGAPVEYAQPLFRLGVF